MSPWAKTDIRLMSPVGTVVLGFKSRLSEVRYLIMMVAGTGQSLTKQEILMFAKLIRSLFPVTTLHQSGQSTARLHRKLVCRHMIRKYSARGYIQGPLHRLRPLIVRKLRKTENQIDTDIGDSGILQNGICLTCRSRIMTTVHPLQDSVIKRLHTHTYAVDSKFKKSLDISLTLLDYVIRIDLDCEFIKRAAMTGTFQSPDDGFENRKRQHRRGATSYV